MDYINAGKVSQPNLAGDVTQGVALAQAHEKHLAQVEQVKQAREELEMKKAHWLQTNVTQGSAIVDDAARKIYFKRLETQANRIGIAWDPASTPILASKEGALNIQKGQAALLQLPYDAQTKAFLDFKNSLGDPAATEASLYHGAEIHAQIAQRNLGAAFKSHEMGLEQSKMFETAKAGAHTQNKENVETIRYANRIQDMVTDPAARKDPYQAATALAALAKNLFPGGVIRESEMTFLDHINPGMGEKVQSFIQGKLGKGPLTDDMWFAIGQLSQHMGVAAQSEVKDQIVATQKNLPPGMNAEDIYSTIPKFEPKDLRPAFPKMFPGVAAGSPETAQSAVHPNMAPMGPPPVGGLPLDQVNRLNAYAKKKGVSVQQIAQGALKPAAVAAAQTPPQAAPDAGAPAEAAPAPEGVTADSGGP